MMQLIQIYPEHPMLVWLAVAAVLLAAEVMSGSGWLLWAGASAAVTAVVTALRLGAPAELSTFAVLAIASTLAARRYMPRPFRPGGGHDITDPGQRIIGRQGRAAGAFHGGFGRVFVDGKEWAAELEGGGDLDAGATVQVTGLATGACLRVKAA